MPDVLIRGLTSEAVQRIDREAEAAGLSRNEYLRRKFEGSRPEHRRARMTVDDLHRAADAASDLLDPALTESAWR